MILLVDMSGMIHSFFHIRKDDDTADVTERTLEKLERLRDYYRFNKQPGFDKTTFVAVFDNPYKTFRHILFDGYKAGRTKHEGLPEILNATREAVGNDADWIAIDAPFLLESDDLLASIAKQYTGKVMIYSNDRDMHSCLEDDRVVIIKKANVDLDINAISPEYFSYEMFVKKYKFTPSRWNEYQAMVGDASDGLKPLSWGGCGEKMATKVMMEWGGCPSKVNLCKTIKFNKTQRESFQEFAGKYDIHMKLLTLLTDVPWPKELAKIQHHDIFTRLGRVLKTADIDMVDEIRRFHCEEANPCDRDRINEMCSKRMDELNLSPNDAYPGNPHIEF